MVVSLHDVHPSSLVLVERQRADLRRLGVSRLNLLVVPRWHGAEPVESAPEFVSTISRWRDEGDEITLHGWTHSIEGLKEKPRHLFWTRFYTNREAEFLVASAEETRSRIATGRALLESFGWSPVGFIAPAWLLAPHTIDVLRTLGFAYTNTRTALIPLRTGTRPLQSSSLCYSARSAWRRLGSQIWNPLLARSLRHRSLLRVSIHPSDILYSGTWLQILRLTRQAIDAGRVPRTYAQCAVPGA